MPERKAAFASATKELVGMSPYQIAQAGIAYVPQGRHIFSDLTTKENLLIARKKGPNGEPEVDA